MIEKGLIREIIDVRREKKIRGIQFGGYENMTHFQFVNDLLIFLTIPKQMIDVLRKLLIYSMSLRGWKMLEWFPFPLLDIVVEFKYLGFYIKSK